MAQVCRTCLEEVTVELNYFKLYGDERSVQILNQFNLCIPEMSLGLVKNPIICTTCASMLHLAYNFKQKCLNSEVSIKNMVESFTISDECTLPEAVQNSEYGIDLKIINALENREEQDVDDKSGLQDILRDIDPEMVMDIEKHESFLVNNQFFTIETLEGPDMYDPLLRNEEIVEQDQDQLPEPVLRVTRLSKNVAESGTLFLNETAKSASVKSRSDKTVPTKPSEVKPRRLRSQVKSKLVHNGDKRPFNARSKKRNVSHATLKCKKKHKCKVCDFTSEYAPNLYRHALIHDQKPARICHHCGYKTLSRVKLIGHMESHKLGPVCQPTPQLKPVVHTNKDFACDKCNFRGKTRKLLMKHIKIHVKKPKLRFNFSNAGKNAQKSKKQIKCEYCKYKTKSQALLDVHVKVHSKSKRQRDLQIFFCSHCEYTAKTKSSLNYHKLKHELDTPFGCIVCTYVTYDQYNLVQHMRRHNRQSETKTGHGLVRYDFVHHTQADTTG